MKLKIFKIDCKSNSFKYYTNFYFKYL